MLLILINYPNMGGIVPTQAVGPASCSKRVQIYLNNKKAKMCISERGEEEEKSKEKDKKEKQIPSREHLF